MGKKKKKKAKHEVSSRAAAAEAVFCRGCLTGKAHGEGFRDSRGRFAARPSGEGRAAGGSKSCWRRGERPRGPPAPGLPLPAGVVRGQGWMDGRTDGAAG